MEPADTDRRLNRALERLPAPRAPRTLLPRVMQAVDTRVQTAWYRREWRQWPVASQALALSACIGLAAIVMSVASSLPVTQLVSSETLEPAQTVTRQVEPTVAALQILWRVVVEPLLPALVALVTVMGAACVAIGLTLNYVVLGRTWQR